MGKIYSQIEDWLRPIEWLTNLLLIGIIAVSGYMLFFGDNVQKTAWTVYMYSP